MQWFVGYRRLSETPQASRRAFYEFTCLGAGLDFAQARLYNVNELGASLAPDSAKTLGKGQIDFWRLQKRSPPGVCIFVLKPPIQTLSNSAPRRLQ